MGHRRHETEFIENITEAVWSKLQSKLPPDFDFVVGIESRIEGTKEIQWIVLNSLEPHEAYWDREAFSNISNLRLLIMSGDLNLCSGFKSFPQALKVLRWDKYNLDALPHGVQLDELVDFKMRHSKIKQLWKETQFMDLSHCIDLTTLPNFDGIPYLERLVLEGCKTLVEIHQSLGQLKKLVIVNLRHCTSLKTLPRKLEMNSLVTFILSGCSKIRKLPEFGETMERLSTLDLEETSVIRLPESLAFLTGLTTLNLRNCKNLVCLPNVIQNLRSIKIIDLSGCSKCEKLPENWNENKAMEELDVSGTAIKEVPSSIFLLENLNCLSFHGCKGTSPRQAWNFPIPFGWKRKLNNPSISTMLMLPSSSPNLPLLKQLDLSYCNLRDESLPKDLNNLSSLEVLGLRGNNFVNLPTTFISNLLRLTTLRLEYCSRLEKLPELPQNISDIWADDCASMEPLLDTQLLGLFASPMLQCLKQQDFDGVVLIIPGSEIPSWFQNQNCLHLGTTDISFTADIPDYCSSSDFWGIVGCLIFHGDMGITSTPNLDDSIDYKYYGTEDTWKGHSGLFDIYDQYNCSHQLSMFFFPCNNVHIKQLQLEFSIKQKEKYKITKYGWRVVRMEDLEAWRQMKCEGSSGNNRNHNIIEIASNNNNEVLVMPSAVVGTVCSLERVSNACSIARAGDSVAITLNGVDGSHVMAGGVLCHPDFPVEVAKRLELKVLVLEGANPILVGSQEPAKVSRLVSVLDPKTGKMTKKCPRCLIAKQRAVIEVSLQEPVCVVEFSSCKALARVSLRTSGRTIAVGLVTRIIEEQD
ncbi:TMV resistance protein N-like [Senna tora]|uniref:TMV resistance protein N-like n=1 Tax=Senna tora TaxID=362788 RepID=A0A834T597_9FABA|nr:TMV resistance protein N-like [Senna tora]